MMDWLKIGAGAALGVLIGFGAGYLKGRADGADIGRTASLTQSVETLRERKATDEAIRNMDDAQLCAAIGGMFADGECQ